MERPARIVLAMLLGVALACGGGSGDPGGDPGGPADAADPGADGPPGDGDEGGPDAADDPGDRDGNDGPDGSADLPGDAPDLPGDAPADLLPDAPPDPRAVFEVRTRPSCVPDGPFAVDTVVQFRSGVDLPAGPVHAVAASAGHAWVATDAGLWHLAPEAAAFVEVAGVPGGPAAVADVSPVGGTALVARGTWVGRVGPDGTVALPGTVAEAPVTAVESCGDRDLAVAGGVLLAGPAGGPLVPYVPQPGGVVREVACDGSFLYAATDGGVVWGDGVEEWAWTLPGTGERLAARNGRVATAGGDAVHLQGGGPPWSSEPGPGGLPTGDITALDVSNTGRFVALGHARGATLMDRETGAVDHFASGRWLPSDAVTSVSLGDGVVPELWVGTAGGASRLRKADIALQDKAGRMMAQLDRWFWRLGGFVSAWARFPDPWTDAPATLHDDDNDGQWTQEAVAAFCYAYAVTGDESWYRAARKAVTNMALQIDIPAADFEKAGLGRGFVTRSFVRDDEGEIFANKATQPNWHRTTFTDGHDYYWKDDTSSDEVTGHLFGFSLYHDLCAKDDAERAFVADRLGALAGYILRHGFTLPDLDGQPTSHGDWSPSRIPIAVDGLEACADAGHPLEKCIESWGGGAFLDALEILALMLAAWHVTGEARFLDAYEELVTVHRYDRAATFHENVVTWTVTTMANFCDHELADLAFLTLLRYEPHPDRRAHWQAQVMAAWQHEVGERNPLKSLVMAAMQQDVPGLAAGARTLADYPEDLREWRVDNGHRRDFLRGTSDRFGEPQFQAVPPHDEIPVQRWDHNPYRVADGGDGATRMAPNFWLLPYWGLRYHGALCPAE